MTKENRRYRSSRQNRESEKFQLMLLSLTIFDIERHKSSVPQGLNQMLSTY